MDLDEFKNQFNKHYAERLKKYRDWKSPPWAKRKNEEIVRSLAHPDLSFDLFILFRCRPESIMAIQLVLEEYFITNYGLSVEMAESWVLYAVTKDIRVLFPRTQIDGVRFFNDDEMMAGPAKDAQSAYKNLQSDVSRKDPHINIRIGRSATKQDVKWLLDRHWNDYVEPRLNLNFAKPPSQRAKRQLLRNSTIYALSIDGKKPSDISKIIDKYFKGTIDDYIVRKIIKEFKPPADWFEPAKNKFMKLTEQEKIKAVFDIKLVKTKTPHFEIEKV